MTKPILIAAVLLATLLAGCGGSGGADRNKAGAPVTTGQRVLHVQAEDATDPESVYLARRIEQRSSGSLKVRLENDYPSHDPANEVRLARALRAGRESFGLLPARAWPAAGVPAFAALQAPFVLSTYDAARAAMAGPPGRALVAALEHAGVVPLALVPTQLRRLLATRPLDTPERFRGARLRITDNATTADEIAALGAEPVQGLTSDEVRAAIMQGRLDGVESAPAFILKNSYGTAARHLTGYALFNKVQTFVASPSAWRGLSASQRAAVRAAAADTARFAATQSAREARDVVSLCRQGVRIDVPTPAALQALAAATEPVIAAISRDPAAGPILRQLRATAGAGPHVLPAPRECSTPARESATEHRAKFPDGVYVTKLTPDDFHRYGANLDKFDHEWTVTTSMHDGRFTISEQPDIADEPTYSGTYKVDGDHLTFTFLKPEDDLLAPETVRWSYYRGELSMTLVEVADDAGKAFYAAHPWRKVR